MTSRSAGLLLAAATALVAAGCAHEPQIRRLQNAFEVEASRGDEEEAAALERKVVALAATDYGPRSDAAYELKAGLATTWGWSGHPGRALALARGDLRELQALHGGEDLRTLPARFAIAWILVADRRWDEAGQQGEDIAALCRAAKAEARRDGDPRNRCGRELDDLFAAAGYSERANAEFLASVVADDPRDVVAILTLAGRRHADMGELPEARWYFRLCLEKARGLPATPPEGRRAWSDAPADVRIDVLDSAHAFDSEAPRCLDDLIAVEEATGNDARVRELRQQRRELWEHGPDLEQRLSQRARRTAETSQDPALTTADLDTLGWYRFRKGRPADAIAAWSEASRLLEGLGRTDGRHPDAATAWRHVDVLRGWANASEGRGAFGEAEQAWSRAFAIADVELHPRHAWRLEALAGVARAQAAQKRDADAEGTWQRYLDLVAAVRGPSHVDAAAGLEGLAMAKDRQGDRAGAAALRARARRIRHDYARRMDAPLALPLPAPLRSPPSPATSGPTETGRPPPDVCTGRPDGNPQAHSWRRHPWLASRFAETPSTWPASCRRSATPPPTST